MHPVTGPVTCTSTGGFGEIRILTSTVMVPLTNVMHPCTGPSDLSFVWRV